MPSCASSPANASSSSERSRSSANAVERLDAVEQPVGQLVAPVRHARARRRRLAAPELAGEQAAGEREVRDEPDAQLARERQQLGLGGALEQAVLVLHGGEPLVAQPGRLAQLAGVDVRDPERPDQALVGELAQRAERLGQRGDAVGLVVVEEVDPVGAQPLQRALDGAPDVRARPTRHAAVPARVHAELRRQHHAVAPVAEDLADQRLGRAGAAVDVGGVEVGDAGVERGVDHGPGPGAVEPAAEVVAAQAHGGHREAGPSEWVLPHRSSMAKRAC